MFSSVIQRDGGFWMTTTSKFLHFFFNQEDFPDDIKRPWEDEDDLEEVFS